MLILYLANPHFGIYPQEMTSTQKCIYECSAPSIYNSKYDLNVLPWEMKYGASLYNGVSCSFDNDDWVSVYGHGEK